MATYSYPILSNSEILACLRELDVPLEESDLLRPTRESLRPCYETLVEIFIGKPLAEICAIDEEAFAKLDYPELYEEAIPNLMFIRAMQDIASGSGIDDFGLKDIFKPEYGRTRRNLSAFINFAKFREERLMEYEEALAKEAEEERLYREELELHERLKAEIAQAEEEGAGHDLEELEREVAELEREVQAATLEAEDMEAKAAASRKELEAMEAEERRLQMDIEQAKEAQEKEAHAEAQLMEEEQREAERLQEELKRLQNLEDEMQQTIETMKEIERLRNDTEQTQKKIKAIEEEIASKEEEIWKTDAKIEQLQRQKEAMDEKIARMKEQGKLKIDAAEAAVKAAEEELAAARARVANQNAQEEANKKEIAKMEAGLKRMTDEHNREMDELMRAYEELRDTVVEYHNELFEAMEAHNTKALQREREIAMSMSPGGSSVLSTPPSAMSIDHY